MKAVLDVAQLKWSVMLRVDLGPVTEVREATKEQVRHPFRLFISHAFTPTKDNSPKRRFQISSHYGVKIINV